MKISKDVYKLSGWEYGTNSNVYGIKSGKELILIDAGFSEIQYQVIEKNRNYDPEIKDLKITDVFLTHAHGDHAGLAFLYQQQGAVIHIGEGDADALEEASSVMLGDLFGKKFHGCKADDIISKKERYKISDNVSIQAIPAPGHTEGTMIYLAEVGESRIVFLGDILVINSVTPTEEILLEVGWKGSPDYNDEKNCETLKMLQEIKCDIVALGHTSVYFGSLDELLKNAQIKE